MAYGEGWEVLVSEEFQSQVDILAESHGRTGRADRGSDFHGGWWDLRRFGHKNT